MKEKDIIFSTGTYFVTKASAVGFKWDGYCVLQNGTSGSLVVGRIGHAGEKGFNLAVEECKKRENKGE